MLGFPAYYQNEAALNNMEFPTIGISGLSNLGQATFTTLLNRPSSHIIRGDLSKVSGKHTIMAGAEYRQLFLNFTQQYYPGGQYGFNAGWTQGNFQNGVAGNSTTPGQGFGMASFLLGAAGSGAISHGLDAAESSRYS